MHIKRYIKNSLLYLYLNKLSPLFTNRLYSIYNYTLGKPKEDMLINILTRASGRTKGFKKCYESIANQTYKNVRHIVTYDCDDDLSYLNTYAVEKIKVDKEILIQNDVSEQHENYSYFPYNLYCNELLKEVKSGWVLFLDDDDMLAHKHVLVEIVANLKRSSQDTLFIWQMKYPDGRIKPRIGLLFRKEIRWSQIGSPCFLFHSSYAHRAQWDAWKSADYRFVKRLSEFIPNTKVIAKPMILLNNHGGKGKRKDIVL